MLSKFNKTYANVCERGEAMAKTTIKDVAEMAGVCTSTVSRVLSGGKNISEATCKRVHEAVKKLN